jgi:hypothetical protein
MNLYTVPSMECALDLSTNDDRSRINLSLHSCSLTDDEYIRSINLPPKYASDSHRAIKTKLPLKLTTLINDSSHCSMGHRYL